MAETAEVFALRQKVRDLRGQLHSRDKALRLKREEFIPKEVANMEAHYARLWKSLCEAREELKAKNEQLMAQESELSALRARLEAHEGSAEPGFPELHADSHGHDVEQLLITHGTLRNRRQ